MGSHWRDETRHGDKDMSERTIQDEAKVQLDAVLKKEYAQHYKDGVQTRQKKQMVAELLCGKDVPLDVWDDIGNYSALGRFLSSYRGNSVRGNVFTEQTENCSIFAEDKLVIGFGVKDLVIVDTGDVVLVMDKNRDQEIKYLVKKLKDEDSFGEYL